MDPSLQDAIRENLRLTRENNAMLHRMRRNAFIGGFFKFVIYAVLFAAPIWFYMTYVSNSVDDLLAAVNKLNGNSSAAQTKLQAFEAAMRDFDSHLPAFMQAATTSSTTQ